MGAGGLRAPAWALGQAVAPSWGLSMGKPCPARTLLGGVHPCGLGRRHDTVE